MQSSEITASKRVLSVCVSERWTDRHSAVCVSVCVSERWTDTLLYVKNIGENVTEDDLKQVFTECEDIVLRKAESKKKDDKKTRSVGQMRSGQTCLVYCETCYELSVVDIE